jgi:hypothetical protein
MTYAVQYYVLFCKGQTFGWGTVKNQPPLACVFVHKDRATMCVLRFLELSAFLFVSSLNHHTHSDHKFLLKFIKMKLLCFASLLASAAAFTSSGAAFTTQSYNVGERSVNIAGGSAAHHSRKATIVMSGKANGTYFLRRIGYCSAFRRSSRYDTESTRSLMLGMESKIFILYAMQ